MSMQEFIAKIAKGPKACQRSHLGRSEAGDEGAY